MTTTVVPGPQDALSDVAGRLLAIAEKLGHPVAVVKMTHDPAQVFNVPDDVADAYSAEIAAKAEETSPKRRAKAREEVAPDA